MTIHYDPVDDITYFVMMGDTCRYAAVPSGTPTAYLESVPDDSGWATGPQPLIQPGVSPDAVIPPPQFGMNDPFAYTTVALPLTPTIVAQVHFSIPPEIAAKLTVGDSNWKLGAWVGGSYDAYLNGVQVAANTGANFETVFFTFAQEAELTAGGDFVLGFYGGLVGVKWGVGVTLFHLGRIGPKVPPPLRQFPRDDFVGGAPRQGHQSTSTQASSRQGYGNTYR